MRVAAGLAVLLIVWQVLQGANSLLQYGHLVTTLAPYDRMLGDWFARCVPADTRILTASYSYVPPAFKNVAMGEGYRDYMRVSPDIVTVRLTDATNLSENAKLGYSKVVFDEGDLRNYYNLIMRSDRWRAGPVFGPFQVFTKSAGRAKTVCH